MDGSWRVRGLVGSLVRGGLGQKWSGGRNDSVVESCCDLADRRLSFGSVVLLYTSDQ